MLNRAKGDRKKRFLKVWEHAMNSVYATTLRQFCIAAAGALLAMAGHVNRAHATIVTLGSGNELEATFTAVPNTADLLWFFDNTPLTVTGSPVISVELLNGSSALGTYTQTGASVLQTAFEATGSQYTASLFKGPHRRRYLLQPSTTALLPVKCY
jgi:hypothetical protein